MCIFGSKEVVHSTFNLCSWALTYYVEWMCDRLILSIFLGCLIHMYSVVYNMCNRIIKSSILLEKKNIFQAINERTHERWKLVCAYV